MRHELFWPALYLPEDQVNKDMLRSDTRLRWTFEAELVFDLSVMARSERFDGGLLNLDVNTIAAGGKPTLDQVISEYTARDVTDLIAANAAQTFSRRFS